MTKEAAVELIDSSLSADSARVVREWLRPCIFVRTRRVDDVPIGASKFGGHPDLPANTMWPVHNARQLVGIDPTSKLGVYSKEFPAALHFLGQVRLEDISSLDMEGHLPRSGMLFFFYDMRHGGWGHERGRSGGWRVIHTMCDRHQLVRTPFPGPPVGDPPSHTCALAFSAGWSLPSSDTISSAKLLPVEDELDAYQQVTSDLPSLDGGDSPLHQMLGRASGFTQGSVEAECQSAAEGEGDNRSYSDPKRVTDARRALDNWLPLFQLDSDEAGPGWMFADLGTIYFMIRRDDLLACRFDRVWFSLQTS